LKKNDRKKKIEELSSGVSSVLTTRAMKAFGSNCSGSISSFSVGVSCNEDSDEDEKLNNFLKIYEKDRTMLKVMKQIFFDPKCGVEKKNEGKKKIISTLGIFIF
jgi:hypothetical protein